jgi:rare lipoprotein A
MKIIFRTFNIMFFASMFLMQSCTGLVRFSSSDGGTKATGSTHEKPVPRYEPVKPQNATADLLPDAPKEQQTTSLQNTPQEKPLKNIDEKEEINEGRLYSSGEASFYGGKFHGRKTANGEIFDSLAYTAAHKTLPFNTKVRVENSTNGRSVVVRINDRGPFAKSRIIDLSVAAARDIDMIKSGKADVDVYILE